MSSFLAKGCPTRILIEPLFPGCSNRSNNRIDLGEFVEKASLTVKSRQTWMVHLTPVKKSRVYIEKGWKNIDFRTISQKNHVIAPTWSRKIWTGYKGRVINSRRARAEL